MHAASELAVCEPAGERGGSCTRARSCWMSDTTTSATASTSSIRGGGCCCCWMRMKPRMREIMQPSSSLRVCIAVMLNCRTAASGGVSFKCDVLQFIALLSSATRLKPVGCDGAVRAASTRRCDDPADDDKSDDGGIPLRSGPLAIELAKRGCDSYDGGCAGWRP
ncbi:hypothetical protein PybrP1_008996 [[Pythium] brassicae (nom. inval.)]|nr:hypothetical protein PybrP1_008996 [[Pythium] brassicae (nom. inval.)]